MYATQAIAAIEFANNMFEYSKGELKVMYKWQESTAPYAIAITKKQCMKSLSFFFN